MSPDSFHLSARPFFSLYWDSLKENMVTPTRADFAILGNLVSAREVPESVQMSHRRVEQWQKVSPSAESE